jgi:hypothetical protein
MTRSYDPTIDTRPADKDHPINLADLKDILGKVVKDPTLRDAMKTNPEQTLRDMNYAPHPAAVDFFKSLSTADFDKAADSFKGVHNDPSISMAEA